MAHIQMCFLVTIMNGYQVGWLLKLSRSCRNARRVRFCRSLSAIFSGLPKALEIRTLSAFLLSPTLHFECQIQPIRGLAWHSSWVFWFGLIFVSVFFPLLSYWYSCLVPVEPDATELGTAASLQRPQRFEGPSWLGQLAHRAPVQLQARSIHWGEAPTERFVWRSVSSWLKVSMRQRDFVYPRCATFTRVNWLCFIAIRVQTGNLPSKLPWFGTDGKSYSACMDGKIIIGIRVRAHAFFDDQLAALLRDGVRIYTQQDDIAQQGR